MTGNLYKQQSGFFLFLYFKFELKNKMNTKKHSSVSRALSKQSNNYLDIV